MYVDTYTYGGTYGYLVVNPNGDVDVEGSSSTRFTSLAGISFLPASSELSLDSLSLQNGWTSANPSSGTGDPVAGVVGGIVYLSGSMEGGPVGSPAIMLPASLRPPNESLFDDYTADGTVGSLAIFNHDSGEPNGAVVPSGDPSTQFTSLDSVSYPSIHNNLFVQPISLTDGYLPSATAGAPTATVDAHGIVHLAGAAYAGTSSYAGTLPGGDCPAHTLYIPSYTYASPIPSWVVINSSCGIYFESQSGTYAQSFTSLATISFPAGV
jgi:hypothetical protein